MKYKPNNKKDFELQNNFEQKVFTKIHKKQRKNKFILSGLLLLFFIITSLYITITHISEASYKKKNFQVKYQIPSKKSIIHLTDKYYLPTQKANSYYLISDVPYQKTKSQI